MLLELSIRDFAIISALRLPFGPHFDVFTGETGAGKSIIIDAISALLGERVSGDVVRAGAERATIEGVFDVTRLLPLGAQMPRVGLGAPDGDEDGSVPDAREDAEGGAETLAAVLAELQIEPEDGMVILSRDIARSGRGIARVNGRAVPLSTLQRLARVLVDIHGQSAHLTLLRPEQHIYYLDRYAEAEELRGQVAVLVAEERATKREIERLQRDERELERRLELLRYQVEEIEAARLQPGELEELERERRMLMNAERLLELCEVVHAALSGDETGEVPGAVDQMAAAQRALGDLVRLDDSLRDAVTSLDQAAILAADAAAAVRAYQDEVGLDPARQAEVEERLDLIAKLRRKYGATLEDILAYAEESRHELNTLAHREERLDELMAKRDHVRGQIGALAEKLSVRRRAAAHGLSAAMEHELGDLNMRRARFEVHIEARPDSEGVPAKIEGHANGERYAFSPTGIDRVEFLIAPNPGEPPKPLAKIASGGETSRLMLALKTILSRADAVPLLIFDEIDTGISGHSGQVVGEKLWQLARAHQVVCITHLPQIAALGDNHYHVSKMIEGDRTATVVEPLTMPRRVEEIGQMLGGAQSATARANAAEMIERAQTWKAEARQGVGATTTAGSAPHGSGKNGAKASTKGAKRGTRAPVVSEAPQPEEAVSPSV